MLVTRARHRSRSLAGLGVVLALALSACSSPSASTGTTSSTSSTTASTTAPSAITTTDLKAMMLTRKDFPAYDSGSDLGSFVVGCGPAVNVFQHNLASATSSYINLPTGAPAWFEVLFVPHSSSSRLANEVIASFDSGCPTGGSGSSVQSRIALPAVGEQSGAWMVQEKGSLTYSVFARFGPVFAFLAYRVTKPSKQAFAVLVDKAAALIEASTKVYRSNAEACGDVLAVQGPRAVLRWNHQQIQGVISRLARAENPELRAGVSRLDAAWREGKQRAISFILRHLDGVCHEDPPV